MHGILADKTQADIQIKDMAETNEKYKWRFSYKRDEGEVSWLFSQ